MKRVALVRGKYLNMFEGQNYLFKSKSDTKLTGISSLTPLHKSFPFKTLKLPSPVDFFDNKVGRFIANRTIGEIQILFGLEKLSGDFDIFHTADPHYFFSYQLAKLRQVNKIRLLLSTSWETIPFNNESTKAKRNLKRFTARNIDHYICPTERAKKALEKEGVSLQKISMIRFGVDLGKFSVKKQNKRNKITILFIGRFIEEKGVLDLLKAFKNVRSESGKEIDLKLVGDGHLRPRLINFAKQNGLTNNVSIRQKTYEEIPSSYQEADIMVIPSKTTKTWEEQYGMVAIEAMASGLPIIAYQSGALPEVLLNAALFVKEGDIQKLTKAIVKLTKEDQLRLRLGTIARRRAEDNFDSKIIARKYEQLYKTLYRNIVQKRRKKHS